MSAICVPVLCHSYRRFAIIALRRLPPLKESRQLATVWKAMAKYFAPLELAESEFVLAAAIGQDEKVSRTWIHATHAECTLASTFAKLPAEPARSHALHEQLVRDLLIFDQCRFLQQAPRLFNPLLPGEPSTVLSVSDGEVSRTVISS